MDIQEIMDTIPLAFWKSLAFQQIAKREDLQLPKWSILVNNTGVQVSLFWQSSTADAAEEASAAATFENGTTNHVSGSTTSQLLTAQKSELLERIQRIKDENEISLPSSEAISPSLQTLLQAAMQKGLLAPNSTLSVVEPNNSITSSSSGDEPMSNHPAKLQDVLKQINMSTSQALGEKPAKIRRKSTPIKNLSLNAAALANQASKRLVEIKNHHLSDQNGPFGATLASMAAAMGGTTGTVDEDIETIDTSVCIKQEDEEEGMDQIERIAAKTGTLQTLQKMRTEAQRGTLNLSKAVRLLARCLFNEDELVVESIKDLDQHKVDLLHSETTKWYNCTMTEVRQVMSFRLSEIRKTKRASHWGKRAPQQSNGNTTLMLGLPTMLNEPFILPKPTDIQISKTTSSPNSSN
ncbi:Oidioi.mRNA.OKI2018_I69.XSR.g15103.t1.cds [Oikopleura dioica]|uniref:Oidioi.mRNA.OKI2018_I69.XSR.g15103.t1.cds n=1 Tax=Oikopleura dioica TaxID=34765 RepID=A0ABN7SC94_OIKDI|nr:Oidioi.mRNA.OKI2018_I69.XSR.g15103.t1.cds [Oikopleura dioica]